MVRARRVMVDTGDPDWRHDLLTFLAQRGFTSDAGFLAHHGAPADGDPAQLVETVYGGVVNLAAELGYRVIDLAAGGREL